MKRIGTHKGKTHGHAAALALAVALLWPACLVAQMPRRSAVDSILNPPLLQGEEVLRFDQKELRLGTLSEDDAPLTCRFSFRNVSRKAVTITRVATSCGCTVATFGKAPVNPGGQGEVTLVFHPFQQVGTLNKHAFVYTDRSDTRPTARLTLTGKVLPTANPWAADYPCAMGSELRVKRATVRFNDVADGQVRSERLVCFNSGKKPLKLSALLIPRYATFRTEPDVIAPGTEADIVITIDVNLLPPSAKKEFSFPVVIEGLSVRPTDRTLQVKVRLRE